MDYYKRKRVAMDHIRKLIDNGTLSKSDISFRILEKFQLGEKFVHDYIEQLIDRNFAVEHNGAIISTKEVGQIVK